MSPTPPLLTPEEEERLRQYQASLASPQPPPAPQPVGTALDAMAPPAQAPAPQVGPALQSVAPQAAPTRTSGFMLPALIASGNTVNIDRQTYDSLTPVEQQFLDNLKKASRSGSIQVTPDQFLKSFETFSKTTAQTISFSDGHSVNMIGGQQIARSEADQPERKDIVAPDGTVYFSDVQTGQSIMAVDENGNPLREKPKLSERQRADASHSQQRLDILTAQTQQLANFDPNDKVSWNSEIFAYEPAFFGTKAKDLTEKALKDIGQIESRLDRTLNPPAPKSNNPAPTATPASDKFVVGKRYRDANGKTAIYKGNGIWE